MAGAAESSDASRQDDPRPACKYGAKCYQKNPQHHKRFKHPAKKKRENPAEDVENGTKRVRVDDTVLLAPPRLRRSSFDEDGLADYGSPYERTKIFLKTASPTDSEGEKEDEDESKKEEDLALAPHDYIVQNSPENVRFSIEQKFLVEMPKEFFDFWECCSCINNENPEEALQQAGLTLVGPYDILTGKLKELNDKRVSNYICHWRYYYDPPEFMTVIAGDENEYHIGYYRDDPYTMPDFVASMSSVKIGHIKALGGNIFAGVCSYLSEKMKTEDPFKKTPLMRLYKEVEAYAKDKGYSLLAVTPDMKERNKAVVAKTFHGAGIVVPVQNDVGYRELPETYANLRKIMKKVAESKTEEEEMKNFEPLQEIITNVQFGYDEGDYGMGLELGINLFIYGGEVFHKVILHLLCVGYDLLARESYITILQAHLRNRRRGSKLSILDTST
ncbi:histone PARylation factor 1-like [Eriocheir sinensis]|uniref:histone PARylation factor 1-like n=1 Tax=Eriocheir sinensis TaxID=95602 RepID=UPI0021C8BD91|nr:histone PARylation factor 1-like isoform X1 [Eriocheir sinensis]XP_050704334.1 histone PARylation factor 1-like [Eriocheir sinensis]